MRCNRRFCGGIQQGIQWLTVQSDRPGNSIIRGLIPHCHLLGVAALVKMGAGDAEFVAPKVLNSRIFPYPEYQSSHFLQPPYSHTQILPLSWVQYSTLNQKVRCPAPKSGDQVKILLLYERESKESDSSPRRCGGSECERVRGSQVYRINKGRLLTQSPLWMLYELMTVTMFRQRPLQLWQTQAVRAE